MPNFFSGLFGGGNDPYEAADRQYRKIPGTLEPYFNPYIQAGQRALPGLEKQFGQLINDPGGRLNQIGGGYQQSPGFQFALQQALQGAGHSAAAGGMAGSPQHEQQSMGIATNLANQDYNQWLQHALGMYGAGLSGQQGLYNTGANAGIRMGEDLGSVLAQRGRLGFEGANLENQRNADMWGAFGRMGGAALAAFM